MNNETKTAQLKQLYGYKQQLRKSPQLRRLFLELTLRCNENCLHCGSRCNDVVSEELPLNVYYSFLDKIKHDFSGRLPMLCITGGEPMLRKEFFDIVTYNRVIIIPLWEMAFYAVYLIPYYIVCFP